MPSRPVIIGAAILAMLAGAAFLFPMIAGAYSRSKALARCADLEAQRAAMPISSDPSTFARIDSEIRACQQSAAVLGANVDLGTVALNACMQRVELIDREFNAYKATAQEDLIQRNNKRASILHYGAELIRCFEGAIADADSLPTIDAIRAGIASAIAKSQARSYCFDDGSGRTTEAGCSRYGVNEPHNSDRAVEEFNAITRPLKGVADAAAAKRDALRAAARSSVPTSPAVAGVGALA